MPVEEVAQDPLDFWGNPCYHTCMKNQKTTSMFISCPVSFDLCDAEWFDNVNDAKDDALVWSVELNGESVVVYEALDAGEDGYEFKPLSSVFA